MIINLRNNLKKLLHKTNINFLNNLVLSEGKIKLFPRYSLSNAKHSVVGWVPNLKNKTKIIIFNFFSLNYSIREDIESNIYLIKDQKIVDKFNFYLKADEIKEYSPSEIFKNDNGDTIIVELISKKIKKNHGGHDGHFRFWGKYIDSYGNTRAITHSMPLSLNDLFGKSSEKYSRNYHLKFHGKEYLINFYPGGSNKTENKKSIYGYNMIINGEEPNSAWHLSPPNMSNDKCTLTQGFYCPKSLKIDPIIILDPNETGLKKNDVEFFILKNNEIKFTKKKAIEGLFKERISSLFQTIEDEYSFFIKFKSLGLSHAHVHYSDGKNLFDQVHMHDCNWEFNGKYVAHKELRKKRNCRKFFCYDLKNSNLENYIIIHNEKIENKSSNNLRVRLFQGKKENLLNINLQPNKPIEVLNVKEIFENATHINSLIQIESTDYNFHASGLILNRSLGNIYTDHFTGG